MRFVLAIICFVLAALALGFGVAERTILAGPDQVTATTTSHASAPVVVIDGSALNAYKSTQTVKLSGSGTTFAAYGATSDVLAWVGDANYTHVRFNATTGKLQSVLHKGTATTVPSPAGSDLWLAQYSGAAANDFNIKIPASMSVIAVSNGTDAAPSTVSLSWPLDNSTPWSGPLILIGAIALLLGLIFLLWAFTHLRRTRGPRRSPMPKLPRQPRYKPKRRELSSASKGRRAVRRVALAGPAIILASVVLVGCTTAPAPRIIPSSNSAKQEAATGRPAVTKAQLQLIMSHIASTVSLADSTLNPTLAATRLDGAALADRTANYIIRKRNPKLAASVAIPATTIEVTVPARTTAWPHTVFTVVQNKAQPSIAPVALMLVQDTPRANYKVEYAISLQPKIVFPHLAPADEGASRLSPTIGVLKLQPQAIALAYGDILDNDTASSFYNDFDANGDSFRQQVGQAAKIALQKKLPSTAKLTFSNLNGIGQPIAIATIDSGAIVAVDLNEVETVKPVQAGAAVSSTGDTAALLGTATSTKGIVATYGDQLLFYVPKAGASGKIELLGYSQGLVSAVQYSKKTK